MARTTACTTTPLDCITTPPRTPATPAGRRKPPMADWPIWVTVIDAMRLSGIGRTTIYKLMNDGTLHSITIGKRRLISYASIEALGGEGA